MKIQMYGLTILHNSKRLCIKWNLSACSDEDDTVCFTNASIGPESDYTLQLLDENTSMVILYKNMQIVHFYFHPERMIYILQFIHSGSVVREYYLEDDVLEAKKKYTVTYAT
jgi:hypothetical protein